MKNELTGIIPAAGLGTRLGPKAFSKELFPIGFESDETGKLMQSKAVSQYLVELMREAGVEQVYFILRDGKWDIPHYYGDGSRHNMYFAYLLMNKPYGPPFSVDQAYNFVRGKTIVFGFPDIIVEPKYAFTELLQKMDESGADVVLGLFDLKDPAKWDVVETDKEGYVHTITPKPKHTSLTTVWSLAVWSPAFTEFMHTYLQQQEHEFVSGNLKEIHIGHVMQAAIVAGLKVQSVYFEQGKCLDTGTPEDLQLAIRKYS